MQYFEGLKKTLHIVPENEKKKLIFILFLMIVGMMFETLGIAAVLPFIGILVEGSYIDKFPILQNVLNYFGSHDEKALVLIGLGFIVIFYIIKNIFLIFLVYIQSKFSSRLLISISNNLFDIYLHQPYTFHLQRNSSELIRNVMNEVGSFGSLAIQSYMLLFTETFVLLGILAFLLFFEPVGTISAIIVVGLAGGAYYFLTKRKIIDWGNKRQYHEGMRIKHLQQGMGGAKIVKLLNQEKSFYDQYSYHTNQSTEISRKQSLVGQLPRFLIEIIAISGLSLLIIFVMYRDNSTQNIMPILGLFAMAAFRIMPSVNRILYAMQNLKYGTAVINLLYKELTYCEKVEDTQNGKIVDFEHAIDIKNIVFKYPGTDKIAINNVSFNIKRGQTIGFIGESGAGKSTMADILLGLLEPEKGEILADGVNIFDNIRSWQKQIGYVPQEIYLTDDSLRKNIAFGLKNEEIDDNKVWECLKYAQLDEFVKSSQEGLDRITGERGVTLSGGQRQRIGIARALYHDPSILLFDEATSALDMSTEAKFIETIKNLHGTKTIIIVAHRLSTVEHCDLICRFKNGKISEVGSPKEVLK